MNHNDAIRLSATERYLLKDLDEDLREEFEEHFFECLDCATDVRSGAAMLDQMKVELGKEPAKELRLVRGTEKKRLFFLQPAWAAGAIAALLLVIGYQNLVEVPHLKTEIAAVSSPEIVPSISLVNATSRAGKVATVVVPGHSPLVLKVDVPTQDRFSSYEISLYTPAGEKPSFSLPVTSEQAKNTLSIEVPAADVQVGENSLVIEGLVSGPSGSASEEIERSHFQVSSGN